MAYREQIDTNHVPVHIAMSCTLLLFFETHFIDSASPNFSCLAPNDPNVLLVVYHARVIAISFIVQMREFFWEHNFFSHSSPADAIIS